MDSKISHYGIGLSNMWLPTQSDRAQIGKHIVRHVDLIFSQEPIIIPRLLCFLLKEEAPRWSLKLKEI